MKRRKLYQYAQTSAPPAPAPAGVSTNAAPAGVSRRESVGPGPKVAGIVPFPGTNVFPGDDGVETPFDPSSPGLRLMYPEYFGDPGEYINSPHCYLPNNDPNARPGIDRGSPIDNYEMLVRLGFQPQPHQIGTMARGDAGVGETSFRRAQIFAELAPVGGNVCDVPMSQAIALATSKSTDTRLRNWQVSVFGIGVVNSVALARAPLTASQIIQNGGFLGNTGTLNVGSTAPYVPQITTFKARAMIHDESGQRFFDFDVIGTRNLTITAYSVTIFALIPANGNEVDAQNTGSNLSLNGILQDAILGCRVVPMSFDRPNRSIRQTQTITLDDTAGEIARMPIPPGAKLVQIYNQSRTAANQNFLIDFDAVSTTTVGATVAVSTMGPIIISATTFRSDIIEVPNASSIQFVGGAGAAGTSFIVEFEIDP